MRRVTDDRERGAVAVLTAVFAVVMVAMAALVVDVGALHDERRQLQNGADAAALAVAHSCALGGACDRDLAPGLAAGNARDEAAMVDSVDVDPTARKVTVSTSTEGGDGGRILPFSFAQIITGSRGKTVHARATATWSALRRAPALPLAVSRCDLATFRTTKVDTVMLFAKNPACEGSTDAPGAFGWLDTGCPDDPARKPIEVGSRVAGDPGKSDDKDCLDSSKGKDVLVPVYDGVTDNGRNTTFDIVGFAALHLTGWRFPGDASTPAPCGASASCISGRFIDFVTTGTPGPGALFGVSTVHLVS